MEGGAAARALRAVSGGEGGEVLDLVLDSMGEVFQRGIGGD
jgi:hypothetical protein